jgi:hypothetical protein
VADLLRTATAIHGSERAGYWTLALERAQAKGNLAAPARTRIQELEVAIADLEAHLRRQVLTLEDE